MGCGQKNPLGCCSLEEPRPCGICSGLVLLEQNAETGQRGMGSRMEQHVRNQHQALAAILDLDADVPRRMACEVHDRDARHDLPLAVDVLKAGIEPRKLLSLGKLLFSSSGAVLLFAGSVK